MGDQPVGAEWWAVTWRSGNRDIVIDCDDEGAAQRLAIAVAIQRDAEAVALIGPREIVIDPARVAYLRERVERATRAAPVAELMREAAG